MLLFFVDKMACLSGIRSAMPHILTITCVDQKAGAQSVALRKEAHGRNQPNGGKENGRYFNEAIIRGRCPFRASDKKMEP